jgi:dephospho-CoA kinase
MYIIGILGGVGSGKSLVAGQLARLGAGLLDADSAAHEVLRQDEIKNAARERWGAAIFGKDGQIDRSALAKVVFAPPPGGPVERKHLEELTHPAIGRLLKHRAERLAAEGAMAAILDAPVLLEAGWGGLCDRLIFVDTPRELRLERVFDRGWNEEDFAAREAVQESLDLKRSRADATIDNSSSAEQTFAQVERFWKSLIG